MPRSSTFYYKGYRFFTTFLRYNSWAPRKLRIGERIFESIPVADRLSYSHARLFELYREQNPPEIAIGRLTFTRLLKLLTTEGSIRTGLSTYYVDFQYCNRVVLDMLHRLHILVSSDISAKLDSRINLYDIKNSKNRWNKCVEFLKFDYAQTRIQKTSSFSAHCSEFILGSQSTTTKTYAAEGFKRCDEIFNIPFDLKVAACQLAMHMHEEQHRIEVQ